MRYLLLFLLGLTALACNRKLATTGTTARGSAPPSRSTAGRPTAAPATDEAELTADIPIPEKAGPGDRPAVDQKPAGKLGPLRLDRRKKPLPPAARPPAGETTSDGPILARQKAKLAAAKDQSALPLVVLRQTPCEDRPCPAYELTVLPEGEVTLEPEAHLKELRDQQLYLNYAKQANLAEQIRRIRDLADLQDLYPTDLDPFNLPENQSAAVLELPIGEEGELRRITVYGQAPEAVAELIETLENYLDEPLWVLKSIR